MTRPIFAAAALLAVVTGCSTGGGTQTASPTASPTVGPSQGGTVPVNVASSSFGDHLTGAGGKALYMLTTDGPSTSSCSGDCATNWPPLVVGSVADLTAGTGVTGALGTFARGTTNQATINGMPLYYFAGDTAATDVNGQGQGGVWFLVAPDGGALGQEASPPASTPTPNVTDDGDGYPYP